VQVPAVMDSKSYSSLRLTSQLTVLNSKANAGGVASYSPLFISVPLNMSEIKPGHLYAVCFFNIKRDQTKAEYYQQYHYELDEINPVNDHLPGGIIPILHPW
jgi:hypothetical protein